MTDAFDEFRSLDSTQELFEDLRHSDINFSISSQCSYGIKVKVGDATRGVVEEQYLCSSIGEALTWLPNKAKESYPASDFAWKRKPRYVSPYMAGASAARAAGCICCPRTPEEEYPYAIARCPEHGFAPQRVINGQLVEVDFYWRPDRLRSKQGS